MILVVNPSIYYQTDLGVRGAVTQSVMVGVNLLQWQDKEAYEISILTISRENLTYHSDYSLTNAAHISTSNLQYSAVACLHKIHSLGNSSQIPYEIKRLPLRLKYVKFKLVTTQTLSESTHVELEALHRTPSQSSPQGF